MAPNADSRLALDFIAVRRAIGLVGAALPLVLLVAGYVAWGGLRPSLSDYHGTGLRDVFVGLLCAVGVFLFAYRGHKSDYHAGQWAGLFAVGVAFFPNTGRTTTVHFVSAAAFFVTLALTSLFLFTKSEVKDKARRPKGKRRRDLMYRLCGGGILACLALIGSYKAFLEERLDGLDGLAPVFWLEALAVWFFALSWLVKGEALRSVVVPPPVRRFFAEGDDPPTPRPDRPE